MPSAERAKERVPSAATSSRARSRESAPSRIAATPACAPSHSIAVTVQGRNTRVSASAATRRSSASPSSRAETTPPKASRPESAA